MLAVLREPWRTRLLFLSLAGNLFSVALIGSHVAMQRPPGSPDLDRVVDRMARSLPPADAAQLRAVLAQERPWYEQSRHGMEEARADLSRAIAQTPYDEPAVRARMQALQTRWVETSGRFGESLLMAIRTLSPEGRAKLANATAHPGHR